MGLGVAEIIGDKRTAILDSAAKNAVKNVRVFGSVVRGEATEDSDVDFLVDISGSKFRQYMAFYRILCDMFGRKVDMISDRSLHKQMAAEILAEAKPL